MVNVLKRDGRKVEFDIQKIEDALKGAAKDAGEELSPSEILSVAKSVLEYIDEDCKKSVTVEEIQNFVEKSLKKNGYGHIVTNYSSYRTERTKVREIKSDLMKAIGKIGVETDRDNANVGNNFSSKLLRIASESNKWHNLASMPKELAKCHENGELYYHDLDSYNLTVNCLHIPTREVLEKGFNTGYGTINVPNRIESAAELSCILLQATQNDMFGGQSHPDFDNDMSIFIEPTRQEIRKEYEELGIQGERLQELIDKKLRDRVRQAMQGIIYNLNTMHSRAGQMWAV